MGPAQFVELGVEDGAEIVSKESKRSMLGWMTKYKVPPSERVVFALDNFKDWVVSLVNTDCTRHAKTLGIPWYNEFIAKYKATDPLRNFADKELVQFKPDNTMLHVVWMRAIMVRLETREWWPEFTAKLEPDLFSQNLPSCIAAALRNMFNLEYDDTPKTLKHALFMHAHHASRTLQDIVVQVDRQRRKRNHTLHDSIQRVAPEQRDEAQMATIQRVQAQRIEQHVPYSVARAVEAAHAAAQATRQAKRMRAVDSGSETGSEVGADEERCPSP